MESGLCPSPIDNNGLLFGQLVDCEQKVADMKVQLAMVQGNHKEAMDQLADKSRQVVALRTDLDRTQQQNHTMAEEVSVST